jgi:hypothetical protein
MGVGGNLGGRIGLGGGLGLLRDGGFGEGSLGRGIAVTARQKADEQDCGQQNICVFHKDPLPVFFYIVIQNPAFVKWHGECPPRGGLFEKKY